MSYCTVMELYPYVTHLLSIRMCDICTLTTVSSGSTLSVKVFVLVCRDGRVNRNDYNFGPLGPLRVVVVRKTEFCSTRG